LRLYADAHCHLHEYSLEEAGRLAEGHYIAAVSEDYETSLRTLEMARLGGVWPCVGLHPWEVGRLADPLGEAERVAALAGEASCIGEVGLDRRFVPQSYGEQLPVFRVMVEAAVEMGLPLNLHSPGAWREVYTVLREYGVEKAVFHWYTGPLDLLREIVGEGYYVSVNAAAVIQEKMRRVAREAPLESIVVESDGPYSYRGLSLAPPMVREAVKVVAREKGLDVEEVRAAVLENTFRLYGRPKPA